MKEMETPDKIKEPGFNIPEGYFEGLEKRVEARIAAGNTTRRGRTVRMRIVRWSAAAAVVSALALGANFFFHTSPADTALVMTGQQAQDFINEYIDVISGGYTHSDNSQDISSDLLTDMITSHDMEVIYSDPNNLYATDQTAVEQYITDNYNIMELATL